MSSKPMELQTSSSGVPGPQLNKENSKENTNDEQKSLVSLSLSHYLSEISFF